MCLCQKSGSQEILLFLVFEARLQVSMYKNISTHVRPTHSENQEKVENELIFQAGTSCIDSQSVKNQDVPLFSL